MVEEQLDKNKRIRLRERARGQKTKSWDYQKPMRSAPRIFQDFETLAAMQMAPEF